MPSRVDQLKAVLPAWDDVKYAAQAVQNYGTPDAGHPQHFAVPDNYGRGQFIAQRTGTTPLGNLGRAALPFGYEAAKWLAMKGPEALRPAAKQGIMLAGQTLGPYAYDNPLGADPEFWTVDESTSAPSLERAFAYGRGVLAGYRRQR